MSVYDAFVDAGEATTSAKDQKATIIIVREVRGQRFGVREGSVVPDLSKPHFQLRRPPPVPHFSDINPSLGKRSRDDAFRDECLNGDVSHNAPAMRKPRIGGSKERGIRQIIDDLVPSIERELHEPRNTSRGHGSPILIPDTQDSPLRHERHPRRDGSEILGDDEAKSESPEIENSIHSLPLASRDADDAEISHTTDALQESAPPKGGTQDHVQAGSGTDNTHHPTSRSPSNYFSPSSGSLQSVLKAAVSVNQSASSAIEEASLVNPKLTFTRTKSNAAKEGTAENGPITPPSDVSRPLPMKVAAQRSDSIASNGVVPQSRTSSFSYKFRRDDKVHGAESEIDDTQMSPRSRKSLKRPRHARQREMAVKEVGVRELSGLFHHLDDKRPLIQERKRQRKETKWDFSEHIDGLSGTEDENLSTKQQVEMRLGGVSTANSEADDIAQRRSNSDALSIESDKDSNASTERPIISDSLNALRSAQHSQSKIIDAGGPSHLMAADDSDKENADHDQSMYTAFHSSVPQKDGNIQMLGIPRENDDGDFDHDMNNNKQDSKSVVAMHNGITGSGDLISAEVTPQDARKTLSRPSDQANPSRSLRSHVSSAKTHSRKKKSRVEGEEAPKVANEAAENLGSTQAATPNTSEQANAGFPGSKLMLKVGKKTVPPTGPDEQLNHDLQASTETSNKNMTPSQEDGKASSAKSKIGGLGTKTGGAKEAKCGEGSSSQFRKPNLGINHKTSITDQGGQQLGVKLGDYDSFQPAANASAGPSSFPTKNSHPNKSKDGKLGLGFSQSPPRKDRALLFPNMGMGTVDDDHQNEASESPHREEDENDFSTKPVSSKKLTSSQSWKADSPPRSTQAKNKHISVDIPRRKPDSLHSQKKAEDISAMQPVASGDESESRSSVEDSSDSAGEEVSKAGKGPAQIRKPAAGRNAAVQSIEISSNSSGTESDARPRLSKVTPAGKVPTAAPTIVSKGNNLYLVNGAPMVVPVGFTVDSYMEMRATLERQGKQNSKSGIVSSGKSGTPTLIARSSTSTPVPTRKPGVPKNDARRTSNTAKVRDSPKPSSEGKVNKGAAQQVTKVSRAKGPQQPPPAAKPKKEIESKARNNANCQANPNTSLAAKIPSAPAMRTSSQPLATRPTKSTPLNMSLPAKKPSSIRELAAERAKLAAASSSTKASIQTRPDLAKGKNFLAGNDESESESDSDTETNSSDDDVTASKSKTTAVKKTPVATGRAFVDLSIRDPTPSSAGEEDESD